LRADRSVVKIGRQSQSWSVDIMLAVVIFMGAFMLFYAFTSGDSAADAELLKKDGSAIIRQVSSEDSPVRIVDNNAINASRIEEISAISYEELKARLRAEKDFCIFIEDEDGKMVIINNSFKAIGSSKINLSGIPCG
jgi:hypothetical protein